MLVIKKKSKWHGIILPLWNWPNEFHISVILFAKFLYSHNKVLKTTNSRLPIVDA